MDNKKEKELNTADYTRRAVDNYHNKKDLFSLALRKGTKDAIRAKHGDIKLNDYFQNLVDNDLNENITGSPAPKKAAAKKPKPEPEPITDDPAAIFENFNN